jgi:hypothetical protein
MSQITTNPKQTRDTTTIERVYNEYTKTHNVVSPPGLIGAILPPGFSVGWTELRLNIQTTNRNNQTVVRGDAYQIGQGCTLTATALDHIAGEFGVQWHSDLSYRLDDGTSPLLCQFVAVGSYLGPHGQRIQISGTNTTDLRAGSAQTADYNDSQLKQQRKFVYAIAESKARARAFRKAIGLRSMSVEQITRPWVVFQVRLTGQTEDPATQKRFEEHLFLAAATASMSLYGPPATRHMPMAIARPTPQFAPMPVAAQLAVHVDDDYDDDDIDENREPPPETPRALPDAVPASAQRSRDASEYPTERVARWPWNKNDDSDPEKNTPLIEVDNVHLNRLITWTDKNPNHPNADKYRVLANQAQRIIASRDRTVDLPVEY